MAVITVYQCDRDGAMFTSKKEADEYDKQLELAEYLSDFIAQNIDGLDETMVEDIGLLLAKNKEALVLACKGKPESLLAAEPPATEEQNNVQPLKSAAS